MTTPENSIEKRTETWSSITGKIAASVLSVTAIITALGGGASYILDEFYLPRVTSRQVVALDEKMGVINTAVDGLKDVSVGLNSLILNFEKLGLDVSELQRSQRALEIKIERIDAQVDILKQGK